MKKENKKPGEIRDEDLRGVSAGGLKEITPVKGAGKTDATAPSKPKVDLTTNPTPKKK